MTMRETNLSRGTQTINCANPTVVLGPRPLPTQNKSWRTSWLHHLDRARQRSAQYKEPIHDGVVSGNVGRSRARSGHGSIGPRVRGIDTASNALDMRSSNDFDLIGGGMRDEQKITLVHRFFSFPYRDPETASTSDMSETCVLSSYN